MDEDGRGIVPTLLITANVGSIFEDPKVLLKLWIKEFLENVNNLKAKFIALHCQEVGGKNYEESMKHVNEFVTSLLESTELVEFDKVLVFLDEDFTCTEKFTALGNFYFLHNSLKNAKIWDFQGSLFVDPIGKQVFSGNIEEVPLKEKVKFPQKFFPECKWSRKGFIRTRWKLASSVFDLINIHLFHDASNFVAMESHPSTYAKIRQQALQYTLDWLSGDSSQNVPFIIFGDFNFRLQTGAIVKKLTKNLVATDVKSAKNGEVEHILYKESSNDPKTILDVGKKVFDLSNQEIFCDQKNHKWILEYDNELGIFKENLFEFEIKFPPSYPFTEDSSGSGYMKTRCPAWCDRILLSHPAKNLVHFERSEEPEADVSYGMFGQSSPMGDHKPIHLRFMMDTRSGKTEVKISSECEGKSPVDENNDAITSSTSTTTTSEIMPPSATNHNNGGVEDDNVKCGSNNISTRYIYVHYEDSPSVSVFRETTV